MEPPRKRLHTGGDAVPQGAKETQKSVTSPLPDRKGAGTDRQRTGEDIVVAIEPARSLRRVLPYFYDFRTFCKGRWCGKRLSMIFAAEFKAKSHAYYLRAIADGRLFVERRGEVVAPMPMSSLTQPSSNTGSAPLSPGKEEKRDGLTELDIILTDGDLVCHRTHRHEPPVSSVALTPLEGEWVHDDVLVLNKPASIPVHPSGRYHHNSIISMLATTLVPVSKARMLAPSQPEGSSAWSTVEQSKHAELLSGFELYHANTPQQSQTTNVWHTVHRLDRLTSGVLLLGRTAEAAARLSTEIRESDVRKVYLARVSRGAVFPDSVVVDNPILVQPPHRGPNRVCVVNEKGAKSARTLFRRLPQTLGSDGTAVVLCVPQTGRTHQIRVHLQHLGHGIANDPLYGGFERQPVGVSETAQDLQRLVSFDAECADCAAPREDPLETELCIWLHALSYIGRSWRYDAPLPGWATELGILTKNVNETIASVIEEHFCSPAINATRTLPGEP